MRECGRAGVKVQWWETERKRSFGVRGANLVRSPNSPRHIARDSTISTPRLVPPIILSINSSSAISFLSQSVKSSLISIFSSRLINFRYVNETIDKGRGQFFVSLSLPEREWRRNQNRNNVDTRRGRHNVWQVKKIFCLIFTAASFYRTWYYKKPRYILKKILLLKPRDPYSGDIRRIYDVKCFSLLNRNPEFPVTELQIGSSVSGFQKKGKRKKKEVAYKTRINRRDETFKTFPLDVE